MSDDRSRPVRVIHGDITTQDVDVIVNAANSALAGGGGVDGAIHRAAGPELFEACRPHGRCPTGSAVITPGFRLPARYVVHAVGPVWRGGDRGEDALLASCHHEALRLAAEVGAATIAFPAISCGAYRFPIDRAASVAVGAVIEALDEGAFTGSVIFVCFEDKTHRAFARALENALR